MFNPLNAELNPICHLLALLGAHHIFHVSGLRVNCLFLGSPSSTFFFIYSFSKRSRPNLGPTQRSIQQFWGLIIGGRKTGACGCPTNSI